MTISHQTDNIVTMAKQLAINQNWFSPFLKNNIEIGSKYTESILVKPQLPYDDNTNLFSFVLPSLGDQFINLKSTLLYVKGSLKHADKTPLAANEAATLCNFGLYSLFKKLQVTIGQNQTLIEMDSYPFVAHRNLIDNEQSGSRNLENIGYFRNEGLSESKGSGSAKTIQLVQYEDKKKLTAKSQDVEFLGKLNVGLFNANNYLMKGCPFTIELTRSDPSFYVHATANNTYKFFISDIYLSIDLIIPNPIVLQSLETQIANSVAKYTFPHCVVRKFNIPQSSENAIINIWQGILPSRLILTFIAQNQFLGTLSLCPHTTKLDKIDDLSIKINDRSYYQIKLPRDQLLCYSRFLQFSRCGDKSNVNFDTYKNSEGVISLDFNILCQKDYCISQQPAMGEIRLEVTFTEAPILATTMVMYAYTHGTITLDKDRNAEFSIST